MGYKSVQIEDASTDHLQLQAIEILEGVLLVRLRDSAAIEGARGTFLPAATRQTWQLSDRTGRSADMEQTSSGGGPFAGIVDIAFRAPDGFDTGGPLVLTNGEDTVRFHA